MHAEAGRAWPRDARRLRAVAGRCAQAAGCGWEVRAGQAGSGRVQRASPPRPGGRDYYYSIMINSYNSLL